MAEVMHSATCLN